MDNYQNIQPYTHSQNPAPYNYLLTNSTDQQPVSITLLPPSQHHTADKKGLLVIDTLSTQKLIRNITLGTAVLTGTYVLMPFLLLPVVLMLVFLTLQFQSKKEQKRNKLLKKEFSQPFSRYRAIREEDKYMLYHYSPLHDMKQIPDYRAEVVTSVSVDDIDQIYQLEDRAFELEKEAEKAFYLQQEATKISQIINQQIEQKSA